MSNQSLSFTLKIRWEKNFTGGDHETNRREAVAMERLTQSPLIISVFGYCGTSVLNEYGSLGSADKFFDRLSGGDSKYLSRMERLRFSRDAALAVADVHAVRGDSAVCGADCADTTALVHGDIRPWNFIVTKSVSGDIVIKLHDFNAARFLKWDDNKGAVCRFENNVCNVNRSPDECRGILQDEKIDVYGLGNTIFFIVSHGTLPYKGLHLATKKREDFVRRGIPPVLALPEKYKTSKDPAIFALKHAMMTCYKFDPRERGNANDVAQLLNSTYFSVR